MAEPKATLAQLRRAIARELEMPFFKRYRDGYLEATGGDETTLVDTKLTQKDGFWKGDWAYRIPSQETSLILEFASATATLEVPVTAFEDGDQYEIHSLWNAIDIHDAINQAINDVGRTFFETITDETLIILEERLTYPLSGLARTPFTIQKVWFERPSSVMRGTVASATSTTVTLETAPLGVNSNWMISIYAGTGAGQVRQVQGISEKTLAVEEWDTTPDQTSKYALWNPVQQLQDWIPWDALRYDSGKEYPDILYLNQRPIEFEGLRMRLEYIALPQELSNENDTTVVPVSYILPAAVAKLHSRKVKENKTDREMHFAEYRRYQDAADAWLVRNAPHRPDSTILRQHVTEYQPDPADPLGWLGG